MQVALAYMVGSVNERFYRVYFKIKWTITEKTRPYSSKRFFSVHRSPETIVTSANQYIQKRQRILLFRFHSEFNITMLFIKDDLR